MRTFKLGLVINPYAGIGGAMALKGSDGEQIRQQALAMGAVKQASNKARLALEQLLSYKNSLHIFCAAGEMGEHLCQALGLSHEVVYSPQQQQTEGEDSQLAAKAIHAEDVDLLLFAGGDGTARNIFSAVGEQQPVLGIPAGVKIHSGVFAVTPASAGRVTKMMIEGQIVSAHLADVMDIDERAFRSGQVRAKTYGEMLIPTELNYVQAVKMGGKESDELVLADIAAHIAELMDDLPDVYFVMGSGSTVEAIMQNLGLPNTLLGVDLVKAGELIGSDMTAEHLLAAVAEQPAKLVITLIGGQGHILGRGNQQLSPALVHQVGRENILLVASKSKLQALQGRPLLVDSGDTKLDKQLSGVITVITGYQNQVLYPIADLSTD